MEIFNVTPFKNSTVIQVTRSWINWYNSNSENINTRVMHTWSSEIYT